MPFSHFLKRVGASSIFFWIHCFMFEVRTDPVNTSTIISEEKGQLLL